MPKIKDRLRLWTRAASQKVTWYLGTRHSKAVPLTFVVGYPKSGTVWVTRLVADYLQLPYPRLSLLPITFPAVVHGHIGMRDDYPQAMYVLRDPRDAIVSRYFFTARRVPDGDNPQLTRGQRRVFGPIVNKDRVHENMPHFVEKVVQLRTAGGLSWSDHVETYLNTKNKRVGLVRYEELLGNGHEHFSAALETMLGVPADPERVEESLKRCSFERLSGRKRGQEKRNDKFRKGVAGDWRNYFTREIAEIVDRHCGETMVRIGYARDRDWVKECPETLPQTQ